QSVRLPRRTRAASYSGQFVTRYLALGNLWRRLSWNLYGMGFQNDDDGAAGSPYRPAIITAIRPGILKLRRTSATSLNHPAIPAPPRARNPRADRVPQHHGRSGALMLYHHGDIARVVVQGEASKRPSAASHAPRLRAQHAQSRRGQHGGHVVKILGIAR